MNDNILPDKIPYEPLTERETEIISLVVSGYTNRQIAEKLFIEYSTVRWFLRQIYNKLGAESREQAITLAIKLDLNTYASDTVAHQRHNLPNQTTAFVGREADITNLTQLLNVASNRLITVSASGGMGKTRLALEVAERQLQKFFDGVYFIELAPLSSADNIITSIASTLKFHFQADGREPFIQIATYLQYKTILLVLDNFEHLMDGAQLTTDLLKHAPNLNILVTSRQKLNQVGETVYNLSGMEYAKRVTLDDSLNHDAVQLFLQSAKRTHPEFQLTEDNINSVEHICDLVQGMPLGIILSAGWLHVLNPEEIVNEIKNSIDFLATEASNLPKRQHSIRAVFDHSWDLMRSEEQDAFMKLSVFRGGFTREAAESVAGANLRVLLTLTNKSLIHRRVDNGRYEIHELLRQYAEEQLVSHRLEEDTLTKHASYFSTYLKDLSDQIINSRILNQLDDEFENIRSAFLNNAITGTIDPILNSHQILAKYLDGRARHQDAISLFENMIFLLSAQSHNDPGIQKAIVRLKTEVAVFHNGIGHSAIALSYAHKCLHLAKSLNDDLAIHRAYDVIYLSNLFLGEFDDMLQFGIDATKYFEKKNLLHKFNTGLHAQTMAHIHLGNLLAAKVTGLRLYQLSEVSPVAYDDYSIDLLMGLLFDMLEDYKKARVFYAQSLEKSERFSNTWAIAIGNLQLGNLMLKQNRLQGVEQYYQKAFLVEYDRHNLVDMFVIMMGIPAFLASQGQSTFAIRLASFVLNFEIPIKVSASSPTARPLLYQTIDRLKADMSDEIYAEMWESGKSLSFEEVKEQLYDYFTSTENHN